MELKEVREFLYKYFNIKDKAPIWFIDALKNKYSYYPFEARIDLLANSLPFVKKKKDLSVMLLFSLEGYPPLLLIHSSLHLQLKRVYESFSERWLIRLDDKIERMFKSAVSNHHLFEIMLELGLRNFTEWKKKGVQEEVSFYTNLIKENFKDIPIIYFFTISFKKSSIIKKESEITAFSIEKDGEEILNYFSAHYRRESFYNILHTFMNTLKNKK